MAAKLVRLVCRIQRYGMKYVDQGAECYDAQYPKQQVIHLKRKAAQLGLQIIEVAAAPKTTNQVSGGSSWRRGLLYTTLIRLHGFVVDVLKIGPVEQAPGALILAD